ncbi:MAG: 3-hydroxyacyl-ACP dehydratase FabZ [Planctomycetaceae bacterium]|nr:3-hydroxyacyl-ACP dehydratase FabZ [Planctomycetaceae bacterium]
MVESRSLTQAQIQEFIPHRDPFLWIDEVVELTETRIHARKKVSEDLDVFRGHYPHFPVLPGVLQCEAAFQAGAILIAQQMPTGSDQVPVVTRLNNVQFRKMVRPGDTLDLEVELTEKVSNAFFLKGKVSVNGKVTVRLEFACSAASMDDG